MNEAIKLAIEKGGYRTEEINQAWLLLGGNSWKFDIRLNGLNHQYFVLTDIDHLEYPEHKLKQQIGTEAEITHSPQFWQALSKALGWGKLRPKVDWHCWRCGSENIPKPHDCNQSMIKHDPGYKEYWHEYIDVLAKGGDTERFWKELLTSN